MQKVLTAARMREVDRLTTEQYGIPSILLMENAAHAVARVITERLGGSVEGKQVLILCGKGNNGGDGAALARILVTHGAVVTAMLVGEVDRTKGDARTNFDILRQTTYRTNARDEKNDLFKFHMLDFDQVSSIRQWVEEYSLEPSPDCVVDALFGTGLSGELDSQYEYIFQAPWFQGDGRTDEVPHLRVAIDIPSGLQADTSLLTTRNASADVTVTFTAPKLGNVLPPASNFNGELIVAEIGPQRFLVNEIPSQNFMAEQVDAAEFLRSASFETGSYKNKRGHALLIAGSKNYTGAAVLAGDAAIRSGCGLVTVAVPESSRESVVARVQPEVMVRGISETEDGSAAGRAADEVNEFVKNVDAVAVGSGLSSKEDETKAFVRRIVEERQTPVVIDADGLTALSPWATSGTDELPLIPTPHEGEFRKMLGLEKAEFDQVIKDRVQAVRDFATKHDVFLVLKGERNLIGSPDGRVVVNPTGNSGLGKAGNGDTLTGIITGFVAQAVQMKIDILETLVAAVYVAGMAGDIAENKYGKRVMTASDVRECLVEVFSELGATR